MIEFNKFSLELGESGGQVAESSFIYETCPSCGQRFCCFDCDGSQGADENNTESESDVLDRIRINQGFDTIEWFTLALCLGLRKQGIEIDTVKDSINEAITTVSDTIGNQC